MLQTFNINDYVRVKLTDEGRKLLREQHASFMDAIKAHGGKPWDYEPPKEDAEGWSRWQMHNLMEALGHACTMGRPVPFETEIQLELPDAT